MRADPPTRIELPAPAKVNLGLRVLGRRPDGYHLLESLFVPLDLADEVSVEVLSGVPSTAPGVALSLEVRDAPVGPGEIPGGDENLAVRAARAFLEAARLDGVSLEVRLGKRIPAAAGLGGGSSDAGAVLRALARLFPGALPGGEVVRLALGLGADVPFFLDPRPALVSGVGETIEPVEGVPGLVLVLANPGESLATAEVYSTFDELRPSLTPVGAGSTMRALSGLRSDPNAFAKLFETLLENDLEPAAVRLCPPIARLRERLRVAGALVTGMSGSGATVFGLFPDEVAAERALARAAFETATWTEIVRTVGSSRSGGIAEDTPRSIA